MCQILLGDPMPKLKLVKAYWGIGRNKLQKYMGEVFVDVRDLFDRVTESFHVHIFIAFFQFLQRFSDFSGYTLLFYHFPQTYPVFLKYPFDQLVDFLENRMRLSHVYQPLMIRSLVDAGGSATLRQLANAFLLQDESQLLYYEKRIKELPLRVLKKHGVVERDGDLLSLAAKKLTLEQKAQVRMLCERKMQEYVQKRGLSIWDHRLLDSDPVPDTTYYQVLAESGGRCALCGATKKVCCLLPSNSLPYCALDTQNPFCQYFFLSKASYYRYQFPPLLPYNRPVHQCVMVP
jgi:hypothetical protein